MLTRLHLSLTLLWYHKIKYSFQDIVILNSAQFWTTLKNFLYFSSLRGRREVHIPGQNIRCQKQLLEMSESSLTQTLLFCNSKFLLSTFSIILNLNLVFFHESKDLANLTCKQVSMIIAIAPYLFSLEHQLNFTVGLACCLFGKKAKMQILFS